MSFPPFSQMHSNITDESNELIHLRAQVKHLEETNRSTLESLTTAARLSDFKLESDTLTTPESILEETARRAKELIRFKGVTSFLVDEITRELTPVYHDQTPHLNYLMSEFKHLTSELPLERVLQSKYPSFAPTSNSDEQLLLHPIRTAKKTLGLFIGLLDEDRQTIPDSSLSILPIVLQSAANTLDNLALNRFKEAAKTELESKVKQLRIEIERRKQSELDIENTRNFLTDVINTIPEPLFVKDERHRFLMVNDSFCSFTSHSREELYGKTSYDIFQREEANSFHRKDAKVMLSGKEDTLELLVNTPDGLRHFISSKKASLNDPQTGDKILVGILRNLTEQKKIENILRMERERFFGLLERIPAFIYVQGTNHIAEYGNEAFRKQFGEFKDKKCYELFHHRYAPCEVCSTKKVLETGIPQSIERTYPNGRTFQTYEHPFDDPDNTRKTIVMGVDVTERNKAIQDLAESEAKYRELVENANAIIIRWTSDGKLTFFNEFAQTFFGFSEKDVLGQSMINTIVPHTESTGRELQPIIDKIAANPERFSQIESENIRYNGTRVWVSWSNQGVYDESGKLTEILSVGTDTTARVKMEKELLKTKNKAEIASKAKGEFLANMSHEIRTPLNGVLGMLQLASMTGVNGEVRDYIDTALESGRNLLTVINDILDISKIEAGKFNIEQSNFSPRQVVDSVIRTFAHQSMEADITLSSEVGNDVPDILIGDSSRIRQVLFNLVGNSMKFTNQGSVSVSIHSIPPLKAESHRLFFTVEDTGIGIPSDKVEYIFDAFTQVDGSYRRKYQGSGLGLGIVKRLVHLMKGVITIDTQVGRGTSISFTLEMNAPEQKATAMALANPIPVTDFDPTSIRLLLAEDNRVNQIMARKCLEKLGFTIECANNGVEALDLLNEKDFDGVLLDIQMPVMDGMEAAQRIRDGEAGVNNQTIPIIALTAHAMNDDKQRFLTSGMDAVVSKPFEMIDLIKTLTELLMKKTD